MMTSQLCKTWRTDAGTKLGLHVGVSLWIMLCYFPPQIWPVHEPHVMAANGLPLHPWWAVVYQSVFLLHTAAIWCARDARAAWLYVREVSVAFAVGAVIFWLWPTCVIRPEHDLWCYEWLIVRVDGAGNAFPSLHAAMGLLGVFHVSRIWPRGRAALLIWLGFMLASTLLTHQHVWQDLAAGLVLAFVIHLLIKRHTP